MSNPVDALGTQGLPAAVVVQPVRVKITMTTSRTYRRRGRLKVRLKLGGRRSPHLTVDEARYVARVIEKAADRLRLEYEAFER